MRCSTEMLPCIPIEAMGSWQETWLAKPMPKKWNFPILFERAAQIDVNFQRSHKNYRPCNGIDLVSNWKIAEHKSWLAWKNFNNTEQFFRYCSIWMAKIVARSGQLSVMHFGGDGGWSVNGARLTVTFDSIKMAAKRFILLNNRLSKQQEVAFKSLWHILFGFSSYPYPVIYGGKIEY